MGLWARIFNKIEVTPPKPMQISWPISRDAGVLVTPEIALTFSAVYRAIAFISQTIGFLPWSVYEDQEIRKTDPVYAILHKRPCPEMGPMSFKETIIKDALGWGNGYAEIEFNNAGVPMGLWRLEPSRMQIIRDDTGSISYVYSPGNSEAVRLPDWKIFHLKGLGDGLVGESIVGFASRSIGMGISAEKYGSSLFANQSIPSLALEHPRKLSAEALDGLRNDFKKNYSGAINAGKPIILEEGMKLNAISMKPEDVQFLESRKFSIEEIARWFGLPPHKLADLSHATFSNIEHQSQEVVNDALMPWCKKMEEEADYKLLSRRRTNVYTKIDTRGLLRGDAKSRMEFYKGGIQSGIFSVNEARAWEDLPPIEGGDKHLVQMQMIPLEDAGKEIEQKSIEQNVSQENKNGLDNTSQG